MRDLHRKGCTRLAKKLHGLKDHENAPDQEDESKQSLFKRMMALRDKLKLGPHHKMERFTIMLSVTLSLLLIFSVVSFISYRSDVSALASSQASFTDNFTFSLSGEQGTVEGVYGNKNHTDVMVLFKLENPEDMSANAKNYRLFITGDSGSISYKPHVTFALFGSTGYGIIRFQSPNPIPQQVLDVTIRSKVNLSDNDSSVSPSDDESIENDSSFKKYDQARLVVNPGAQNIKVLHGFKSGETDPSKLYTALVAKAQDQEIHHEIKDELKTLSKLLDREKEYTNRIEAAGYIPPKQPWIIQGDKVQDGRLYTSHHLVGAYVFNYWDKDISDGYVNQVVDTPSKLNAYMTKQKNAVDNMTATEQEREEVNTIIDTIKSTDGSTLDLNGISDDDSSSSEIALKSNVTALADTWSSYASEKSKLEHDLLSRLLLLDSDVLSQPENYSASSGKEAVIFY